MHNQLIVLKKIRLDSYTIERDILLNTCELRMTNLVESLVYNPSISTSNLINIFNRYGLVVLFALTSKCLYLCRLYLCGCKYGASSRKPYNVGEKNIFFFFLADLNSPDSKL